MAIFKRGLDQEFNENISTPGQRPGRFRLAGNQRKEIIFLTNPEDAVVIQEYEVWINQRPHYIACPSQFNKPDPIAPLVAKLNNSRKVSKYTAAYLTVIDIDGYTDKQGVVHTNVKQLFVAKKSTKSVLLDQAETLKEDGHTLRGAKFRVSRSSDEKAPRVGDSFIFRSMVDLATLPDATEFDYEEVLSSDADYVQKIANHLKMDMAIGTGAVTTSDVAYD